MADEVVARVSAELDGERLDKAIAVLLDVSRTTARELVESGALVDGEAHKPGDRVSEGATITARLEKSDQALEPMEVDFESLTMTGKEDWYWEGPGGTCPDSESVVTAVRVSD